MTKTNPPHVPTCAWGRQNVASSIWGKSQADGISRRLPSRFQLNPWYGQRKCLMLPERVRSWVPRWRHELWKAEIVSGPVRTTTSDQSAIS